MEAYAAKLFITLKDHKCLDAIYISRKSHEYTIQEAARAQGFQIETVATRESADYSIKPVQFVLTRRLAMSVRREIHESLQKICHIDLNLKVIDQADTDQDTGKHIVHFQTCFLVINPRGVYVRLCPLMSRYVFLCHLTSMSHVIKTTNTNLLSS